MGNTCTDYNPLPAIQCYVFGEIGESELTTIFKNKLDGAGDSNVNTLNLIDIADNIIVGKNSTGIWARCGATNYYSIFSTNNQIVYLVSFTILGANCGVFAANLCPSILGPVVTNNTSTIRHPQETLIDQQMIQIIYNFGGNKIDSIQTFSQFVNNYPKPISELKLLEGKFTIDFDCYFGLLYDEKYVNMWVYALTSQSGNIGYFLYASKWTGTEWVEFQRYGDILPKFSPILGTLTLKL